MTNHQDKKRLFFGLEIEAPWPEKLPRGRLLDPAHRHMTLAFLGEVDYSKLKNLLSSFPMPPFAIGPVGWFDEVLFLPPKHPHVAAWHVQWMDDSKSLVNYYKTCAEWLRAHDFDPHAREVFLPHVTISRSPFEKKQWEKAFKPLPLIIKNIHLYESIGQLKYEPVWSLPLKVPFVEMDHTADIAFQIFGEDLNQIFQHAKIALAFAFPPIMSYFQKMNEVRSLEEIVFFLNQIVSIADGKIGCPFKAVSYHGNLKGDLKKIADNVLIWEMIIDV